MSEEPRLEGDPSGPLPRVPLTIRLPVVYLIFEAVVLVLAMVLSTLRPGAIGPRMPGLMAGIAIATAVVVVARSLLKLSSGGHLVVVVIYCLQLFGFTAAVLRGRGDVAVWAQLVICLVMTTLLFSGPSRRAIADARVVSSQ